MLTLVFKTLVIYVFLLLTMRIMGKRQLGELDMSELVITILLSEIASAPITDTEKPLTHAFIPIAALAALEILISFLIIKFPKIKQLFTSRPSVLIARGVMNQKEMSRVRISLEELISQIRQNGIFDLDEVDYAILEENGKMSIIPKSIYRQPDRTDLDLPDRNTGVMHILISDGNINHHSLKLINKDRTWLDTKLNEQGAVAKDIFCMTCNDADDVYIIMKKKKK